MNSKTIAALGVMLGHSLCPAQLVVHDPINAEIAVQNQVEEMLKLVKMIEQIQTTKDWLGHAGEILDVAGLNEVFANLQNPGVGMSRADIAFSATSRKGVAHDGDGVFVPVHETFVSRDGQVVRRPDVFKPEAAIFSAVNNHDEVYADVMARRERLRSGIQQTLSQLQGATTHAEVLKATGVLMAQNAELETTDHELTMAVQKALLLDIENRADRERQEKAREQEQAREMSEALRLFGDAMRPPIFDSIKHSSMPANHRE